ncbi:MAG: hypothetical protein GWP91_06115, partial [Rhodobacterales bacterium]|nr:hypothetical protein [Rhodobacterales bacterium]
LTPLTQFRSHPVEPALKLIFMAASGGTLEGVLLASGAITSDMYMVSFGHIWLCYLIFLLTIHLRHSQHGMSFGPYLSYLFSSPSMHHIHHSTNREHIDKNFAIVFSFWDWIFGSFYLPTQNETFRIGLTDQEEEKRFQGLRNHLVEPFLCLLRRKSRPMRQDDQKDSAA